MATLRTRLLFYLLLISGAASAQTYTVTFLDSIGSSSAAAYGINDSHQVIGNMAFGSGSKVILWNNGTLTMLTAEGDRAFARAINNRGRAVGSSNTSDPDLFRAVVWINGTPSYLATPGDPSNSQARDINNAGEIIGDAYQAGGLSHHAVLWSAGVPIDLGTLGGPQSFAYGINGRGQVVGVSDTATGRLHATLWYYGSAIDLGSLGEGSTNSAALGINDAGKIVGSSVTADKTARHAILWDGGLITELATASGGTFAEANAINNAGVIVGWSTTGENGFAHAAVWKGTGVTDLNDFLDPTLYAAGWRLAQALDIDNDGFIVGFASRSGTGEARAFLATPSTHP